MNIVIPTDEQLRDRVDTAAVRAFNATPILHVSTQPHSGSHIQALCGSTSRNDKPWRLKEPNVYPNACWCKDCAFLLWNKKRPNNSERQRMTGDAYE